MFLGNCRVTRGWGGCWGSRVGMWVVDVIGIRDWVDMRVSSLFHVCFLGSSKVR